MTNQEWASTLTCDDDQSSQAGKGGDVQVHAMEALGELHDGINPVTKTADTLQAMQHHPIAEDQLVLLRIRPSGIHRKSDH